MYLRHEATKIPPVAEVATMPHVVRDQSSNVAAGRGKLARNAYPTADQTAICTFTSQMESDAAEPLRYFSMYTDVKPPRAVCSASSASPTTKPSTEANSCLSDSAEAAAMLLFLLPLPLLPPTTALLSLRDASGESHKS